MKPSDFFTRSHSNEGQKMPIPDPLTGLASGEFLIVKGFDSDAFQAALVEKSRKNAELLTLPEAEQPKAKQDAEDELYIALVSGWSFSEKFTPAAVGELIREAPYIRQAIDAFGSKRANFIKRQAKS